MIAIVYAAPNEAKFSGAREFISGNILVEGNDLDQACLAVSEVFVGHRLRASTVQPARHIQVNYKRLDALAVCLFDYGREVEVQPDLLDDFYLVQVPLQGGSRIRCGSKAFDSMVGMASVLPAQREFTLRLNEDCQKILVQVDRRKLTAKLEAYLGCKLTRSPDFDIFAHDIVRPNSRMYHAIEGLMSLAIGSEGAGPGQSIIASAFEDAFIFSMLFDVKSDMSSAVKSGAISSACPKAVRRAEEYINSNLSEPIRIEDLVAVSGVSARSIFDGFTRFRDMTPMRYVKFRRLHKVRELLREADDTTMVSSVAVEWGFNHFGRFAKDYAQAFGESPSETLRAAKNSHWVARRN